jgi:hypothetical protein
VNRPTILALIAVAAVALAAPAQAPLIEPHSGVSFPASLTPPGGTTAHWITGTGIRELTVFIITVQIYAFGLYVDREAARAALADYAVRPASSLAQDVGFYGRLLELEFAMSLRLVMTRDVAGRDVGKAFDEALRPRMARRQAASDAAANRTALQRFRGYFDVGQLASGTEILFSCSPAGRLTTAVAGSKRQPIDSRALCEALFDVYLGAEPISETGKRSVIEGFPELLAGAAS